ncbi:MAG TPA: SulP family inorganic anion transporter [Fulvivirga sp.]|nr:SulP family inorganic anion transporter [Fulvivirga sp.]
MSFKNISNLKSDIPAGLVVFLIALPLCLGIALASGAPLFSGLITGIVGGIVVGSLSGSSLSVSGPAAGLTVIVLGAIASLGSFEAFLLAVVIAGIFQLILGYVRAGIVSHYFPSSVIKGMLSAIGIILILKQIPHAFGNDIDFEGNMDFLQSDGNNTFSGIVNALDFIEPGALLIFLVSITIILIWERTPLKNKAFSKLVPAGLVVVVLGVLLNQAYLSLSPNMFLSGNHVVSIGNGSGIANFFSQFRFPDFSQIANPDIYIVAMTIAAVASIETLLSIEAIDKMDPKKRITSTNRELKAQGVGNIISGLIGGLPMTSVIVRSSANVDAGSKSRMSGIIHGIFLLVSVTFLTQIINLIPLASLAAILALVGYKLARVSLFKQMYALGWDQFIPFLVTIVAILLSNLLTGIAIGMVVSVFFILRNNYKFPFYYHSDESHQSKKIIIKLSEEVTFLNKGSLLMVLRDIPDNSEVLIDGSFTQNIDHDIKEVIQNFATSANHRGIKLELKSVNTWKDHSVR